MADTVRSYTDLLALFPVSAPAGSISEQDLRDFVVSVYARDFGSIFVEDASVEEDIGTSFVKFTGFDTAGPASLITASHTLDRLEINHDGVYEIQVSANVQSAGGVTWEFKVYKNSVETALCGALTGQGGIRPASCNFHGQLDLEDGDILELYHKSTSATSDYTPVYMCLSAKRIGRV